MKVGTGMGNPLCFAFLPQSTNSVQGGPKSWAQLNGKPARPEGGECEGFGLGGQGGAWQEGATPA